MTYHEIFLLDNLAGRGDTALTKHAKFNTGGNVIESLGFKELLANMGGIQGYF